MMYAFIAMSLSITSCSMTMIMAVKNVILHISRWCEVAQGELGEFCDEL